MRFEQQACLTADEACVGARGPAHPPDEPQAPLPLPPRPPPRPDPARATADRDAQRRWILQYAQDQPSSGDEGGAVRLHASAEGPRRDYLLCSALHPGWILFQHCTRHDTRHYSAFCCLLVLVTL